jgi:hypothetical protein
MVRFALYMVCPCCFLLFFNAIDIKSSSLSFVVGRRCPLSLAAELRTASEGGVERVDSLLRSTPCFVPRRVTRELDEATPQRFIKNYNADFVIDNEVIQE